MKVVSTTGAATRGEPDAERGERRRWRLPRIAPKEQQTYSITSRAPDRHHNVSGTSSGRSDGKTGTTDVANIAPARFSADEIAQLAVGAGSSVVGRH